MGSDRSNSFFISTGTPCNESHFLATHLQRICNAFWNENYRWVAQTLHPRSCVRWFFKDQAANRRYRRAPSEAFPVFILVRKKLLGHQSWKPFENRSNVAGGCRDLEAKNRGTLFLYRTHQVGQCTKPLHRSTNSSNSIGCSAIIVSSFVPHIGQNWIPIWVKIVKGFGGSQSRGIFFNFDSSRNSQARDWRQKYLYPLSLQARMANPRLPMEVVNDLKTSQQNIISPCIYPFPMLKMDQISILRCRLHFSNPDLTHIVPYPPFSISRIHRMEHQIREPFPFVWLALQRI